MTEKSPSPSRRNSLSSSRLSRHSSQSSSFSITGTHSTKGLLPEMTIEDADRHLEQMKNDVLIEKLHKGINYLKDTDSSLSFREMKKTDEYNKICKAIIPFEVKYLIYTNKKPDYQGFCDFTLRYMYAEVKVWKEETRDTQALQEKYPVVKRIISSLRGKLTKTRIMGEKERFRGMTEEAAGKAFSLIWDLALGTQCLRVFVKGVRTYWINLGLVEATPAKKHSIISRGKKLLIKQANRVFKEKSSDREKEENQAKEEQAKEEQAKEEQAKEDLERVKKGRDELVKQLRELYPLPRPSLNRPFSNLDTFALPFFLGRTRDIDPKDYFKGLLQGTARAQFLHLLNIEGRWNTKMIYLAYVRKIIELYPDGTKEAILSNWVKVPSILTVILARLVLMFSRARDGNIDSWFYDQELFKLEVKSRKDLEVKI